MDGVLNFNKGDLILIYRTKDRDPAWYRSVVTSVCVIEEVRNMNEFLNEDEYLKYCEPYSIFSINELRDFYKRRKYPYIIKMTYNIAFKKRVTNGQLISDFGMSQDQYWGVFDITQSQFKNIIKAGEVDESIIID